MLYGASLTLSLHIFRPHAKIRKPASTLWSNCTVQLCVTSAAEMSPNIYHNILVLLVPLSLSQLVFFCFLSMDFQLTALKEIRG